MSRLSRELLRNPVGKLKIVPICLLIGMGVFLAACGTQYFPETQHIVNEPFASYWEEHGGLARFGYPLTEGFKQRYSDGNTYFVQYFERAVFELHPENEYPNNVLLSLLGAHRFERRYSGSVLDIENSTNGLYFPETRHWIGGAFRSYWEQNGGLLQFGYPITGEFIERNQLDNKIYTVQYFQRAVFEYHPEKRAEGHIVLLAQLGKYELDRLYPRGTLDNAAIAPVAPPTATAPVAAGDRDGDGRPDNLDKCPSEREVYNNVFDDDGCADSIRTLANLTAEDLNLYWKEELRNYGFAYKQASLVPYAQPVSIPRSCDDDGLTEMANAQYCASNQTVYYDELFLTGLAADTGDFAASVVVAHEWGHHVQWLLGTLSSHRLSIKIELEADCLAGAWVKAVQDKKAGGKLLLDLHDIEEGRNFFNAYGDEDYVPWLDPDAHGRNEQRASSYNDGLTYGSAWCLTK